MAGTALVTGASSGLGAEFARQLAARGADVVLVARDRKALLRLGAELSAKYGIAHEVLVADLLKPLHVRRVVERLEDDQHPVDVLVNSAGYGLPDEFAETSIEAEERHLALHVDVTMRLCHAAIRAMTARGHGRIINLASVAAFIPRGTYAAAKSWVVSFSRWANQAYRDRGITVTAVCPGFTHTAFHERMGLPPGKEGVPAALWLDAPFVVGAGLRDSARRKGVSVPSLRYKALIALAGVLPDSVVVGVGSLGR